MGVSSLVGNSQEAKGSTFVNNGLQHNGTANTWSQVLSITGKGRLIEAFCRANVSGGSSPSGIRIKIDGVTVHEVTGNTNMDGSGSWVGCGEIASLIRTNGYKLPRYLAYDVSNMGVAGFPAVNPASGQTSYYASHAPIKFNSSLVIEFYEGGYNVTGGAAYLLE